MHARRCTYETGSALLQRCFNLATAVANSLNGAPGLHESSWSPRGACCAAEKAAPPWTVPPCLALLWSSAQRKSCRQRLGPGGSGRSWPDQGGTAVQLPPTITTPRPPPAMLATGCCCHAAPCVSASRHLPGHALLPSNPSLSAAFPTSRSLNPLLGPTPAISHFLHNFPALASSRKASPFSGTLDEVFRADTRPHPSTRSPQASWRWGGAPTASTLILCQHALAIAHAALHALGSWRGCEPGKPSVTVNRPSHPGLCRKPLTTNLLFCPCRRAQCLPHSQARAGGEKLLLRLPLCTATCLLQFKLMCQCLFGLTPA